MADVYSKGLQIWDGWLATPSAVASKDRLPTLTDIDRLFAEESLGGRRRDTVEPFSLQWFLTVEFGRHHKNAPWIPRLLEFGKHTGETLLGLGHGLGTDWVPYARHGASVVACSLDTDHLDLVRRNFALRGLSARFLTVRPEALPIESNSIDVACLNTPLPELGDPATVLAEVYRVLKPGGKILAVVEARYDLDFWCRRLWSAQGRSARELRYSARRLRKQFSGYVEHRIYKRHLPRRDIPRLYRWLATPLLERLLGRLLVLKAFKPLSVSHALPLAA